MLIFGNIKFSIEMGFLKTIAILILIYYAFKLIVKYILPLFLVRVVKNVEKKMQNQKEQYNNQSKGKVGETVIDRKPTSQKSTNKNVGEYVDYEEVKE